MSSQNQDRNEEDQERDRREQRVMWIFSAAIILLILGAMGANMLFHKEPPPGESTDISSQSRGDN